VIEQLREAARAFNDGDTGPFLALFDEDTNWQGVTSGLRWWTDAPSCHGAQEARRVMEASSANRKDPRRVDPEFTQIAPSIVLSETTVTDGGASRKRYHVLIFRNGRIRELRAFKSRRAAERFASSGR
jgi:ketosteroid isomerase-like protein